MRKFILMLAAVATTLTLCGSALAATSPQPGRPTYLPAGNTHSVYPNGYNGSAAVAGYMETDGGLPPTYTLHAHAFNTPMTVAGTGAQQWNLDLDCGFSTMLGLTYYTCLMQLVGTSWCANFAHNEADRIYLDSCVTNRSDPNELWYNEANGTTGTLWSFNVAATNLYDAAEYLTADTNTNGSEVYAFPTLTNETQLWDYTN